MGVGGWKDRRKSRLILWQHMKIIKPRLNKVFAEDTWEDVTGLNGVQEKEGRGETLI